MSVDGSKTVITIQLGALSVLLAFLVESSPADAYIFDTFGGTSIKWDASSNVPNIWDNTTKTLTWHFNQNDFPQTSWPSLAQTGAAFENGYKSIQDTLGTSLKIVRGGDRTAAPQSDDGFLDLFLTRGGVSAITGGNISGYFALTHVLMSNASLVDADVEINGGPLNFPRWDTSGPPKPAVNSHDIETTACHEQMHSIGAGHPVYFYSMVWPSGRTPELLQYDRCISPDDRLCIRTLYPGTPAFSTISGTVRTSPGSAAVDRAVIVATNSLGVPQATVVTAANGTYAVNVPAATGYSITAHHNLNNQDYSPSDIPFSGATGFTTANTVSNVNASANVANVNFTVTPGTPTMTLRALALNKTPAASDTNVMFLDQNSSGNIQVQISGTTLTTVSNVSLGPDITVLPLGVSVASNVITIPFTVASPAAPGLRNLSFTIPSGERLFLPAYVEVLGVGALSVAASAGNPGSGIVPLSAVDTPILGVSFTASSVEDVRIRRLRFDIAGSGPALPAVKLWIDNGTVGALLAPPDVRVFSGNAYANTPPSETIVGPAGGSVLFDNLALTVPAGQSVNLLLTANTPAAGPGAYTASFDASSPGAIDPRGMFYGDILTPTGGTVTGGTLTLSSLGISSLQQIHASAPVAAIAVGGSTDEAQITLRATVISATSTVGMDVEVQSVGTAFSNTPNSPAFSSATTFGSPGVPTQVSLTVPAGSGSVYHWQARPTSATPSVGSWASFGSNLETAVDFSVDTGTAGAPSGLQQFQTDGTTPVAVGGTVPSSLILSAIRGTSTTAPPNTPPGGYPLRLEFEVQPIGTAFTNTPTTGLSTAYGAQSTTGAVTFSSSTSGDFHWQVRTASQYGSVSGWSTLALGGSTFHFQVTGMLVARASCAGRATPDAADSWVLWGAGGLGLLILSFAGRAGRKIGGALVLVFVFCFSALAQADEEARLPLSLSEWPSFPSSREFEELSFSAPPTLAAAKDSWISLDAYLSMIFMSMSFQVTGTDLINRQIKGIGTGAFGIEAMITLHPDWKVGLAVEGDFWSDMRILVGGVVGSWRFASSKTSSPSGRPQFEHFAKVGAYYENLVVTKSNFGKFDWGFGARAGYEIRLALAKNWSLMADAEVVYAKWHYTPAILAGNPSLGGIGGLISIGIVFYP